MNYATKLFHKNYLQDLRENKYTLIMLMWMSPTTIKHTRGFSGTNYYAADSLVELFGKKQDSSSHCWFRCIPLELVQKIISQVVLPNISDCNLVKTNLSIQSYYSPNSVVSLDTRTGKCTPMISWLLNFMEAASMPFWKHSLEENDVYYTHAKCTEPCTFRASALMHAMWNCEVFSRASCAHKWYIYKHSRSSNSHMLVWETKLNPSICRDKLVEIFGHYNCWRFTLVKDVLPHEGCIVFIFGSNISRQLLQDDVLFTAFHSLADDNPSRIPTIHKCRVGFKLCL